MLYLEEDFALSFRGVDALSNPYKTLAEMKGTVYRQAKGRKTLRFCLNDKGYFVKLHSGIGWGEVLKNLVRLRLPVIGAGNEWRAISRLQELGVPTLHAVAYGSRGWNPASRQSFVVTEELTDTVSLEDFCKDWKQNPPDLKLRRKLIEAVATISNTLHTHGVCHRDYYLCHFLLHRNAMERPRLSLIDLHRALVKNRLRRRWVIKDIAGLYYSARDIGLSQRDLLRFIRRYAGGDLRTGLEKESAFWERVERRAGRMYEKLGPAF